MSSYNNRLAPVCLTAVQSTAETHAPDNADNAGVHRSVALWFDVRNSDSASTSWDCIESGTVSWRIRLCSDRAIIAVDTAG